MVDKNRKEKYNERVTVLHENGKTVYKLYRSGELIYIGVQDDDKSSNNDHTNTARHLLISDDE